MVDRVYLDNSGNEYATKEAAIEAIKGQLRAVGFKNPTVYRIAYRDKERPKPPLWLRLLRVFGYRRMGDDR